VKQVTHFICVLKFQDWSFAVVNTMLPSSLGKNSPVWYIPNLEEAKGLIQALDPNNQEVELVPGEPLSTNSPPLHWTIPYWAALDDSIIAEVQHWSVASRIWGGTI